LHLLFLPGHHIISQLGMAQLYRLLVSCFPMGIETNANKRIARMRVLVNELSKKVYINTATSRTRCLRLAQESIGLLTPKMRINAQRR
jgi:hypothetical protein